MTAGSLKIRRGLPGFRLTLGFTLVYLTLIVLIPLGGLFLRAAGIGPTGAWTLLTQPRAISAFQVSFGIALLAALIDAPLGLLLAWVITRYRFTGQRFVTSLIDLPLALPTAVAGVALTALYADTGWIGHLLEPWGIQIAFTPWGILVALMFVGLPFVVRTVEPVLQELAGGVEEAAKTLGASPRQTFFRVILPEILPAMLTGTALAFARGVGEYGSVIFIAGNMPGVSEIVPLLIVTRLEEYNYAGAAMLGVAMLVASFSLLLLINLLQYWARRYDR